ncbi:MAG: hypothetical protein HOQ22_19280, partial [Nocardioidaceae bacterium]|nr:hypothetical protein [Nocardioidaceae bacterium]
MSDPELTVDLLSAEHLDAWLADHPDAGDAWLVRWKKGRGPYVGNEDLVCVLLAHGWIDGRAGSLDDDRWRTLISPRRPGSGWSRINKDRVER